MARKLPFQHALIDFSVVAVEFAPSLSAPAPFVEQEIVVVPILALQLLHLQRSLLFRHASFPISWSLSGLGPVSGSSQPHPRGCPALVWSDLIYRLSFENMLLDPRPRVVCDVCDGLYEVVADEVEIDGGCWWFWHC